MSELLQFAAIGALPLGGLGLLAIYHLARGTLRALDRQLLGVYLVVQLVVAGFLYWSLQVHAFGEAVSGSVGTGTDTIGTTSSTRLLIHLDGGGAKEFHFAEKVPAACSRGSTITKPARSTVWTCSTPTGTIEHDANPKGIFLVVAGIGTLFLVLLGRR